MMIIDASAIVAVLADEPEAEEMITRLEASQRRSTTPIAIFEATLGLARIRRLAVEEARDIVLAFLDAVEADVVAMDRADAIAAIEAHGRFGKGRGHPAQLNLGDCFSYAAAVVRDRSLLFKGDDFSATDVRGPDRAD